MLHIKKEHANDHKLIQPRNEGGEGEGKGRGSLRLGGG